ncbi:ferredoxin--NADP reductase [Duganella sp. FT3S]|uniref:ferredoxin--NADP(+) reductase n=1 Tax=Rugamonas fusca TaxID=2758568 RepID=A0A7W2EIL8_9BURK|nr:ferredoxin--NADP reductase [Rugamonas fusca]MBA5606524.1 ferredoxin--NADP reductase [Rugamonas fusca]
MTTANFPNYYSETVTEVHHWNDTLFSFKTTRNAGLRFLSGQFVMMGLEVEGRPLVRAYSIVSPHYDDLLEFYSIKVPNGPLTSRLQHLKVGDTVLVGKKPTGTLIKDNLLKGRNLYLLSTGTGLAPFMSIIRDPEYYDDYEHIVLVHGVRFVSEFGYKDFIEAELHDHEYLGELIKDKLIYCPVASREPFVRSGRIPELLETGALAAEFGLEQLDPEQDRVMICGNPAMLHDLSEMLKAKGFKEGNMNNQGSYVVERAFVEK